MKRPTYSPKKIVLCLSTKNDIPKISTIIGNNHFKWAYLGEDVMNAMNIEKLIGEKGERIDIADKLQKTARALRSSYIDYIGELNMGLPNWWATTISEKNPFSSTTFLYICYLEICKELIINNQLTHLVIFVEKRALRRTIFKNYSNVYKIIYVGNKLGDFVNDLKPQIKSLIRKTYYVVINIQYILIVKYYYKINLNRYKHLEDKSLVLLRDWIDYRSLNSNGHYHSAYLGKLNEHLKSNGKYVVVLPYIINVSKKNLRLLIKSNESFIIPHLLLTIFNVVSKLFIKLPSLKSYPAFENLDITWLIREDFKKDNFRFIDALLYYDFIKNLKKTNFYFESCIYPYENYMDEKIFCLGMKTYYPSTKLIGYQHSTAPKMLLPYFFSKNENKNMPLPDKIITNGPYFTRLFIEEGYPPEKVVTGGAIRFHYLYDKNDFKYIRNYTKQIYNILVTPSVSIYTLELLTKIIQAFGDKKKYKVTIKHHPANNVKKHIQKFPMNFHVSEKPVHELLKENDLLLYNITSVCLEALYVGVPILHVKSDYVIDMDLFDYEQDDIYSAKNVSEIIQMSDILLQMDEAQLKSMQRAWKKVVEDMFSSVDGSVYNLFSGCQTKQQRPHAASAENWIK